MGLLFPFWIIHLQWHAYHLNDQEDAMLQVQANALVCIERVIDNLEKTEILDDVLPMLSKAKLQDPAILMPIMREYK